MKANSAPMSVADYCQDYQRKKIIVNTEYQRQQGIWSAQARSFFIESILLEYPIPKLYLYAKLDLKSRETIKEIVDGQQRSQALFAFFSDKLRLTKTIETEELRGQKYSQLNDDWKARFLSYSLPIDQFSGVVEEEVREAFRRMNANNIPLNDEEQRNARYQGPFKWFIIAVGRNYRDPLFNLGLFSRRDLIRMADLKFYADVCLTLDSGFVTTKAKQIDDLYKRYNVEFPHEEEYQDKILYGVDHAMQNEALRADPFLRAHVYQSIVLSNIALKFGMNFFEPSPQQADLIASLTKSPVPLDVLARALLEPDSFPALRDFVSACTEKTNVAEPKATRFIYFYTALRAA